MKKKMLIALFAMMSVASASAYTVTVNNQTNHRVSVLLSPMRRKVMVNRQQTQRINLSQSATGVRVQATSRRANLQAALFNIPQPKRGQNITININVRGQRFSLSE